MVGLIFTGFLLTEFGLPVQASDSHVNQLETHCDAFDWAGRLAPRCAAPYTPPWTNQRYPEVTAPGHLPRLVLAHHAPGAEGPLQWSASVPCFLSCDAYRVLPSLTELFVVAASAVHPSHAYDQFLVLGGDAGDVRVRLTRTAAANQTTVHIEPVSRVEVSAKEIRGRIQVPFRPPPLHSLPFRSVVLHCFFTC